MHKILVEKLLEEKGAEFEIERLTGCVNGMIPITVSDVNRPGLLLAGFTQNFLQNVVTFRRVFRNERREIEVDGFAQAQKQVRRFKRRCFQLPSFKFGHAPDQNQTFRMTGFHALCSPQAGCERHGQSGYCGQE